MKVRKIMVTILFVLTALFGSLALVACGDTETILEEGPETGEYYYEVQGGNEEYTISLHDGNKVDFKVKEYDLTGTYTVEGAGVTFTFEAEPNTVSASLRDDVLTVTLGEDAMRFYKKISYTVTYMSEGAEFKTETVINGKTATRPAENPSKDNFIFIAWYTDAATYRNLYDFTQPVRSDVTLYARFVEPVDPEFEVTLDYNGGDVTGPTTVETTGRKLFTLPNPTRTGYEFAGWWVSQFGSADKLTYRYTEEQTIDQPITLYAVWDDGKTPLVSIYENGVSWTAKGVNNSYSFKFTGPDGEEIVNRSLSTSSYPYDFTQNKAGEYTAEVTLNNVTGKAYFNNKALVPVSVWNVEGSVFMWNSVPNAEKYIVNVKCADPTHVHNGEVAATDELKYDFSSCGMPEGGIVFTVTAEAEGYASSVSGEFVYTRTLDSVTDVAVDEPTAVLSWKAVENATGYTVSVLKEGESAAVTEEVPADTLTYSLKTYAPGKYTVSVQPSARGWLSPAATAYTYDKVRLATPAHIHIEGMTLMWDDSEGADGYVVTVNGTPHTVNTNSYVLSGETVGNGIVVSVSATKSGNDAITSPASDPLTITSGEKMGEVRYAAGKVSWDAVLGISEFIVKVNEEGAEQTVTGENSLAVSLTKKGENVIYVCGVLEDGRTDWAQCTVTAHAVELEANYDGARPVDSRYFAEGDPVDLGTAERTGYKFDGWYTLNDGGDKFADKTFTGSTDITLYAHWTAREFKITLDPGVYGRLDKLTVTVTYDAYFTIQCPESTNVTKAFAAWRTQPNGAGNAYTQYDGKSLFAWRATQDITLYAEWVEIFEFTYHADQEAFSVSKGEGIGYVRSVTIPEEYGDATSGGLKPVTAIDDFSNCTLLEEIRFPARIGNISLGERKHVAFINCPNLSNIEIYQGSYRGDPAYESKNGALIYNNEATHKKELVFFPDGYLSKSGSTEYEIPDGVQTITSMVFDGVKFTKVTIPASVEVIEAEAFSECNSLAEIIFTEAAEGGADSIDIREKAFSKLKALTGITLPARITNFSPKILYKCTALKDVNLSGTSNGYKTKDGVLIRILDGGKEELAYYPNGRDTFEVPDGVTSIGSDAIVREPKYDTTTDEINENFTSITIPYWVTDIKNDAFKDCTTLKEITFQYDEHSDGLSIGARAFMNCPLTAIELPENIREIGEQAFYGRTSLYVSTVEEVTLPANLKYVGAGAFGNIKALTTVTVNTICNEAESATIFAKGAFGTVGATSRYYVETLNISDNTYVQITDVFGNQVQTINFNEGKNPYYTKVDDVLFNKTQDKIVFYPSSKTGPFTLPASITVIPADLFKDYLQLTEINIPATVTSIGDNAFSGCKNLTTVNFTDVTGEDGAEAERLDIGNNAFKNCDNLKSISLPKRTKTIGDNCFAVSSRMHGLTSIELNEGLESIGMQAFAMTALKEVNIPSTVTEMKVESGTDTSGLYVKTNAVFSVFKWCGALEKVTVEDNNTVYTDIDGILYKLGEVTLKSGGAAEKKPVELLFVPAGYHNESKTIEIPDTVTKISAWAFFWYGHGTTANIETVQFENDALAEVWNAETSKMEQPVLTVNPEAFNDIGPIRTISFPEGYRTFQAYTIIKSIDRMDLETIVLPSTLIKIESRAISGGAVFTSLKHVNFRAPADGKAVSQLLVGDPDAKDAGSGNVFFGCPGLNSIVLPEGTTEIGAYAFSNATSICAIRSVTLPSTVTKIGDHAFEKLILDTFDFKFSESSSLDIGIYAFSEVTGLTSLALTTATNIGANAFDKSSLSSVTFGDNLKEIGGSAFVGTRLSGVLTFPAGIKSIGIGAFEGLTGITGLKFTKPAEIPAVSERLEIMERAFSGCTGLSTVNLEDSTLKTIKMDAFKNTALHSITFPWTITTIETQAFQNLGSLETVSFATDPAQNGGVTCLKEIKQLAFSYTGISSFNFPNSSEDSITLGQKLFSGCSSLTDIYLSKQVVDINNVFNGCGSIGKITVEQGHPNFTSKEGQTILFDATGKSVFLIYAELESGEFEVADGATEINGGAFKGQTQITSLKLPASLMSIGDEAFIDCINLKSVIFVGEESQLQSIGASAFKNCINLETIELEKTSMLRTTMKTGTTVDQYGIGANAFENCYKLQKVDLSRNNGITQLATKTFLNAGRDTTDDKPFEVKLPSTITFLNTYTFQNSGLRTIDLSELKSLKGLQSTATATTGTSNVYLFEGCTKLASVELPDSVQYIGAYVFHGCTALKTINLGQVIYIGNYAFYDCILLSGDQPEGLGSDPEAVPNLSLDFSALTQIGLYGFTNSGVVAVEFKPAFKTLSSHAFDNCADLQSVVFSGTTSTLALISSYAFQNCVSLKEFVIPASVTKIDSSAFMGSGLTNITIPNTVTTMTGSIFKDCKSLTDVTFADGTNKFGTSTTGISSTAKSIFEGSGVETVNLGNRITMLPERMFFGCEALKGIEIPESVTKINAYAFAGSGLKSIQLPKTVTTWGTTGYQFADCASLSEVTFEDGFNKAFQPHMFENCTALTSFTFPKGVTAVANYMFQNSGISSVTWTDVTTINKGAFQNTQFETLSIPASISKLNERAFADCSKLTSVTFEVDETTGKTKAADLASYLFSGCENLRSVKLVDGITDFGDYTFNDCKNLKFSADDLPESIVELNATLVDLLYAGQTEIVIDERFTAIAANTFKDSEATSITLPSQLTTIGNSAFQGSAITSIRLPSTLTTYGTTLFKQSALESVELPENMTHLTDSMFEETPLKSIVLPAKLQTIGSKAFYKCTELTSVDFSGNTTMTELLTWDDKTDKPATGNSSYSSSIFEGCTSLTGIDLPTSLIAIGFSTFKNSGLQRIDLSGLTGLKTTMGRSVQMSNSASSKVGNNSAQFSGCENLTEVVLPDSLEEIVQSVFQDTKSLTSITLPKNLKLLGNNAFKGSAITSISLPGTIATLGTSIFTGCADLAEVTIGDGIKELTSKMFENCASLKTVEIPASVAKMATDTFIGCGSLALTQDMVKSENFTLSDDGRFLMGGSTVYAFANGGNLGDSTLTITASDTLNKYMFRGAKIKKIVFEEGVTAIPAYAFYGVDVEEVEIASSVAKIGEYAFQASVVGKIVIPATVTTIGYKSFADTTIKDITIESPNVWTYSEKTGSYYQNTSVFTNAVIEKISFASGVTVGQNWFENATLPADLDLSGVVTLDTKAFINAKPAGTLRIPTSVTTIGVAVFSGVPAAQVEFDMGDGDPLTIIDGTTPDKTSNPKTYISDDAMFGTAEVISVSFPARLVHLGAHAFARCTTLTTVTLAGATSGLVIGDSAFEGCTALEKIVLPEGVTDIGSSAFKGCTLLASVKLPETLLTIGANAFDGCTALKSLYIPSKVGSMPKTAFNGWDGSSQKLYVGMSRFTFFQLFGSDLYLTSGIPIEFGVTAEEYEEIAAEEKDDAGQNVSPDAEPGKEGAED